MAYATLAEVKEFLGIPTATTKDDTLLTNLATRAQAMIDTITHRTFEASADSEKTFGPESVEGDTLYVWDDLASVTTLKNGDTAATVIPSAGYEVLPRNAAPKYAIRLKSTYAWTFDTDGLISVTGRWAYAATAPTEIKEAAIRLAAWLYRLKDSPEMDRGSVVDGVALAPARMPKDVMDILERRVRRV